MFDYISIIISICAVSLTFYQGYLHRKSYGEQVYEGFVSLFMRLDEIFIEMPELRAYFYEGVEISENDPRFTQVMAVAEMFDDVFAYGIEQANRVPLPYNNSFKKYKHRIEGMPAYQTYKNRYTWINNRSKGTDGLDIPGEKKTRF